MYTAKAMIAVSVEALQEVEMSCTHKINGAQNMKEDRDLLERSLAESEQKRHALTAQLAELTQLTQDERETLIKRAEEAEAQLLDIMEDYNLQCEFRDKYRSELSESKEDVEVITEEKIYYRTQCIDLRRELAEKTAEVEGYMRCVDSANAEINRLEVECDTRNHQYKMEHAKVRRMHEQIRDLKAECERLIKEIDSDGFVIWYKAENERLKAESEELRAELIPIKKMQGQAHVRVMELEKECEELRAHGLMLEAMLGKERREQLMSAMEVSFRTHPTIKEVIEGAEREARQEGYRAGLERAISIIIDSCNTIPPTWAINAIRAEMDKGKE